MARVMAFVEESLVYRKMREKCLGLYNMKGLGSHVFSQGCI